MVVVITQSQQELTDEQADGGRRDTKTGCSLSELLVYDDNGNDGSLFIQEQQQLKKLFLQAKASFLLF